jgi:phosphate transport system permease protein
MTSLPISSTSLLRSGVRRKSRATRRAWEGSVFTSLVLCGTFSILTTVAIIGVLATETVRFFHLPDVSISEFLFGLEWNPLLGAQKHFGIWPLICGTLLVTGVAMLFALPFGLITAIYLSEYAPRRLRGVIKPVLEILAGIPTVVYGFFALTVITPGLQWLNDGFEIYNVCSAGIAVGIMCLPIVCSLSEDALRAVPRSLREGAYGVGATKFDVSVKVVVPSALSGIVAAFLLAIARAVGETMIVALAAGNMARLTLDPRESAQTMTAYMVQIFLGDASNFGPEYLSSYAVAATLFVMTLGLTLLGHQIRVRFREAYQ